MLRADKAACESVIEQSLSHNLAPSKIFGTVIGQALNQIGDLWYEGRITVAHEHRASEIASDLISLVSKKSPHLSRNGLSAIVACVEGDQHQLGAKCFSTFLEIEGWHVYYLGSSMPAKDLAEYALFTNADAVVLSILIIDNIERAMECLTALDKLDKPPAVLIGGSQVKGSLFPGALVANDLVSGLNLLEASLGTNGPSFTLTDILVGIGRNIQTTRKSRGMNQSQLATAADVDRAYISLVENGKQNLTFSALVKLSDALSVPVSILIPVSTYKR